jgi:hypothetical protein
MGEEQKKLPQKAHIQAGGKVSAIVPQTLDDAFRLASALSLSGEMVPEHFRGSAETTMAAIMRGMEVGLTPMQSLANIAVINGRACLWGDSIPAILFNAGHSIDVEVTGEGDGMVATATLIRGDTGQTIVRTFSVVDAKRAGLWGKKGPWQSYPKRMLMHRARFWVARDGAPDALMGFSVAEEVRDEKPIRDITPKREASFADKIKARSEEKPSKTIEVEALDVEHPETGPEVDGEEEPQGEDPAPSTSGADEVEDAETIDGEALPNPKEHPAYNDGMEAYNMGVVTRAQCPYKTEEDPAKDAWLAGFDDAEEADDGAG